MKNKKNKKSSSNTKSSTGSTSTEIVEGITEASGTRVYAFSDGRFTDYWNWPIVSAETTAFLTQLQALCPGTLPDFTLGGVLAKAGFQCTYYGIAKFVCDPDTCLDDNIQTVADLFDIQVIEIDESRVTEMFACADTLKAEWEAENGPSSEEQYIGWLCSCGSKAEFFSINPNCVVKNAAPVKIRELCVKGEAVGGGPLDEPVTDGEIGLNTKSFTYYYDPDLFVWNRQEEISTEETLTAFKDLVDSVIYEHGGTEVISNGVLVLGRETDGTPQALKVDSEGAVHLATEVTLSSGDLNVDVAAFQRFNHTQEDAYVFSNGEELITSNPGETDVLYQVIAGRWYDVSLSKEIAKAIPVAVDDTEMEADPVILPLGGEYRATPTTYTDGKATILQTNDHGYTITDTLELAGEPINLGGGTIGSGTQRVTVASDDPLNTKLTSIISYVDGIETNQASIITLLQQQVACCCETPTGYTIAGQTTEVFDCRTGELGAFAQDTAKQLTLTQGSNQLITKIEIVPATPPVATGLTFTVERANGSLPVGDEYSAEILYHKLTKDYSNNPYDADIWLTFTDAFEAVIQVTYFYEAV